jgi:hypothetical protein
VYYTILSFGLVYHLGDGPLFDHGMIPFLMDLGLSLGCILWLLEPRYSVCEYAIPIYLCFISSISFMILLCMHQFSVQCDFSFRLLVCALRSKTSFQLRLSSLHLLHILIVFVITALTLKSYTLSSFLRVLYCRTRRFPSLPSKLYHFTSPNPQA